MPEPLPSTTKKTRPAKTSPPELLDELTQQKICAIITLGCTRKTAADFVGCRLSAIRSTALNDPQFAGQLSKAEAACEVGSLTQLGKALKDERNWRAVIWLLERRYPDRYGRRKPHSASPQQIADVVNHLIGIVLAEVSDTKDRRRIVKRMQTVVERLGRGDETEGAS